MLQCRINNEMWIHDLHFNHISKHQGAVGVWKSHLTEAEAEAQMLNDRYGDWLRELEYEV